VPVSSAADLAKLSPEERGKKIYNEKACAGCHSLDGSRLVGPTFKGIYGREGKLADGSSYKADEPYIKNSILNSMSQIVEGYPPAMPAYEGQLTDEDINGVIAFMKTLK
jgi:cytochrome c oxidase subunit 2